jgi:hypothetical protein
MQSCLSLYCFGSNFNEVMWSVTSDVADGGMVLVQSGGDSGRCVYAVNSGVKSSITLSRKRKLAMLHLSLIPATMKN